MILNATDTSANDIDFIICTNDTLWFSECEKYIQKLHIPNNMNIRIIPVWNASSMCNGYNTGMRQGNAKYKVYLHHDTFIINPNFITDIVHIFETNPHIGLIGMIGADEVKRQKVSWGYWDYGITLACSGLSEQIISPHNECNIGNNITGSLYQEADCVDGMLIATQYDIPWREDIFNGWDLYDKSICMEFRRQGCLSVVPVQAHPWCIHDCGPSSLYNWKDNMVLFMNTYPDYFTPEALAASEAEADISETVLSQIHQYTMEAENFFQIGDYQSAAQIINTAISQKLMPSKKMMEMYNLLAIGMTCQTKMFFQAGDTLETMCLNYTKARFLLRRLCYHIELSDDETAFLQKLSTDERAYIIKTGLTYSAANMAINQ